jgi:hypothetical protein
MRIWEGEEKENDEEGRKKKRNEEETEIWGEPRIRKSKIRKIQYDIPQ